MTQVVKQGTVGGHLPASRPKGKIKVSCKTVTYFDAISYCWKRAADLNLAREGSTVRVINNTLYAFGGWIKGMRETTPTVEAYDLSTNTWKFVSSLPLTSVSLLTGVEIGGKMYASGMDLAKDYDGDDLIGFVYDPQTDQWQDMADGLSAGWRAQCTVLDGKFYTAGDEYVAGNLEEGIKPAIDKVIQVYNPKRDCWEVVEEVWWPDAGMHLMDHMRLVSFCGKLCIISVEREDPEDVPEDDEWATIHVVMLENMVKDSPEGSTFIATCKDEFYKFFGEGRLPWFTTNDVQVIAL